jgi:5-(carboxyamino)imidazole ribonucleotide synthase
MNQTDSLAPGAVIGILGGGQLGRMLALAAARLGLKTHIYCPEAGGPAAEVASFETNGAYDDLDALHRFAKSCDVVTYEFENVPAMSARTAANASRLRPNAKALDVAQDRLTEKTFIRETAGVEVAPFMPANHIHDARRASRALGLPAVVKTRRFGYDGKGQAVIREDSDLEAAFAALPKDAPCIVEAFVPFKREVSIVAARGTNGERTSYPLIENVHKNHILHSSTAPAKNSKTVGPRAAELAYKIMDALDYVGVMATEFFELEDGSLIVNEIAPRVHNSGHWTQNAGCVDQFELHIRAVAGWPLGSTEPLHPVVMTNLIGDDMDKVPALSALAGAHLHLYGKSDARDGRKMGHINQVNPRKR